jgi:hypothetical protein
MTTIHKHADGVQKFNIPPLYHCATCALVNASKRAVTQDEVTHIHTNLKTRNAEHTETGTNENNIILKWAPLNLNSQENDSTWTWGLCMALNSLIETMMAI